jgi:hypothetical protein
MGATVEKTLFVLGAGASQEAGLPTGKELKSEIAKLLDIDVSDFGAPVRGDPQIWEAIKLHATQQNERSLDAYCNACLRIALAMPQATSIDNFIDAHPDNKAIALCGKLAIVRSILARELRSPMHYTVRQGPKRFEFGALADTWFNRFWQILSHRCTKATLAARFSTVSVISFNYDRTLEHYMIHALQNYWDCDQAEAVELLSHLKIFHPYGVVGHLPWSHKQPAAEFGVEKYGPLRLLNYAAGIKTFTEKIDESSGEIASMRKRVLDAERIVFLGFAFHDDNMELIAASDAIERQVPHTHYYATAHGLSASDCSNIKKALRRLKKHGGTFNDKYFRVNKDVKCAGLFDEYSRDLSLS